MAATARIVPGAPENIKDFYSFGEVLGEGAFSTVYKGTHRQTKQEWAIKAIKKRFIKRELLEREIRIMTKTTHPCILYCKEVFETEDMMFLVLELVRGGELYDCVVDFGEYTEEEAKIIIWQVISAVKYLHSQGIAHRDLKPENILVVEDHGEEDTRAFRLETVKIGDFGLSKVFDSGDDLKSQCGSPTYVAPEVLLCKPYDAQVDMWALGVITFVLLTGCFPFFEEGNNFTALYQKIITCDYTFPTDPPMSAEAKSFIKHLLVRDPAKRMSPDVCFSHPWLADTRLPSSLMRDLKREAEGRWESPGISRRASQPDEPGQLESQPEKKESSSSVARTSSKKGPDEVTPAVPSSKKAKKEKSSKKLKKDKAEKDKSSSRKSKREKK